MIPMARASARRNAHQKLRRQFQSSQRFTCKRKALGACVPMLPKPWIAARDDHPARYWSIARKAVELLGSSPTTASMSRRIVAAALRRVPDDLTLWRNRVPADAGSMDINAPRSRMAGRATRAMTSTMSHDRFMPASSSTACLIVRAGAFQPRPAAMTNRESPACPRRAW